MIENEDFNFSSYEKCHAYWCVSCDGFRCTLSNGDPMKSAICIRKERDELEMSDRKRRIRRMRRE